MSMNSNNSPWWKDPLLILFGAILALSASTVQSHLENSFRNKQIQENINFEKKVLLATLQSEIEANLIYLHNQFRKYEATLNNESDIKIIPLRVLDDVYLSNINQLGKINHLGIIAEIVAFYEGLQRLDVWSQQIITQKPNNQEIKEYASQHANFLHAAIYLHARLSEETEDMPKELSTPSFSEERSELLKSIEKFRLSIGYKPKEHRLRFHSERQESTIED